MSAKMARANIFLPAGLKKAGEEYAKSKAKNLSEIIRYSLAKFIGWKEDI